MVTPPREILADPSHSSRPERTDRKVRAVRTPTRGRLHQLGRSKRDCDAHRGKDCKDDWQGNTPRTDQLANDALAWRDEVSAQQAYCLATLSRPGSDARLRTRHQASVKHFGAASPTRPPAFAGSRTTVYPSVYPLTRTKEKRVAAFLLQPVDFIGGVDGTRTRDPRRDRPVF